MGKIKREQESGRSIWILAFVAVSIFCIVFFAAKERFPAPFSSRVVGTALVPFQRAAAWAGDQVSGVLAGVWDIMTVYEQNRMLRSEVEQLREQNIKAEEFSAENVRLRELLGYKNLATQFDLMVARVIGREAATWTRMVIIDRGTQHGIQKNMAVVTARGLVGVVTEAGPFSSKVGLILDPRVSVGILVQRSRVAGIVEGNPEDTIHPRLVHVPRNEDIAAGDVVVTSGFGGIYPKGIQIGKIQSVKNDATGLLHLATLETAVDFQRLEDVAVIIASREAPPEALSAPSQTPGTESDPQALNAAQAAAANAANEALRQTEEPFRDGAPPSKESSLSQSKQSQGTLTAPENLSPATEPPLTPPQTSPVNAQTRIR